MQSVLISIKPKWCELIANGEKTIEIRKTRPKIETPFKCYIYCTKGKHIFYKSIYSNKVILYKPKYYNETEELLSKNGNTILSGKVIGEFICNGIIRNCEMANADIAEQQGKIKREELLKYSCGEELYGWYISDLKIYDKPKTLELFKKYNRTCEYSDLGFAIPDCEKCLNKSCFLQRPPQSWCYVESL